MGEPGNNIEEHVLKMREEEFSNGLSGAQEKSSQNTTANSEPGELEGKRVIHVDKYSLPNGDTLFRLPSGEGVLIPGEAGNPLDENVVDSNPPSTEAEGEAYQRTHTPAIPLTPHHDWEPEILQPVQQHDRFRPSSTLAPLALLLLLAAGTGTYLFLLPLIATAEITITPVARSVHTDRTLTIASRPKKGQVQGRSIPPLSLTKSVTMPATGHGHVNAAIATGVITFYNSDSNPITIPADVTFDVHGVSIVTDASVTVQAAVPPLFGQAIVSAYALQTGSVGNIPAKAINTRCCGSAFVTATNVQAFSGGQDPRDYSYIQSSDIQNATQTWLPSLTTQVISTLAKQRQQGEQLVTPLCTPHTTSSGQPGAETTQVTVSVTQMCSSVAYLTSSLNQIATSALAQSENLTTYQQVGEVQVTVNGSTNTKQSAQLKVSLSGVWVYHFSPRVLTSFKTLIAGKSQQGAQKLLNHQVGIAHASIHLQRFDFRSSLPTDTAKISIQLFYIIS